MIRLLDKTVKRINRKQTLYRKSLIYNKKYFRCLIIYGDKGTGKTAAALKFCSQRNDCEYYTFKHVSASVAPQVFTKANSWCEFFDGLKVKHAGRLATVFFDDVDIRDDKDDFYHELELFCKECPSIFVVLIMRENKNIKISTTSLRLKALTNSDLSKAVPDLSRADCFRIFTVTNGIYELLSKYDKNLSYEDNLKTFFAPESRYISFLEERLSECFRTPESYNTLLYAIAEGNHRISEIATFAGFSYNKCDKYIKSLINTGFIKATKTKSASNKAITKYVFANSYFALWFKYIYPSRDKILSRKIDDVLPDAMSYIDNVVVPDSFHAACLRYLRHTNDNISRNFFDDYRNYDITIEKIHFDFICPYGYGNVFVKIIPTMDSKFSKKDWHEIVNASQKISTASSNYYILFQNSRFTDYFWKESSELYNLKLVQPEWLRF